MRSPPSRAALYDLFLGRLAGADTMIAFLDTVRRWYGLAERPHVLDVGCGTGRLLPGMCAARWQVEAVEPDPDYRAAAQARAPDVAVGAEGMLELDFEQRFDLICLINGPLAYLAGPLERREALRRLLRALDPGGVVVIDLPDFVHILQNHVKPEPKEASHDGFRLRRVAHQEIDAPASVWVHTDRTECTWAQGNGDDAGRARWEDVVRLAIITVAELRDALVTAGFVDVESWPAWTSSMPGPHTGPRILLSGRRPERVPDQREVGGRARGQPE